MISSRGVWSGMPSVMALNATPFFHRSAATCTASGTPSVARWSASALLARGLAFGGVVVQVLEHIVNRQLAHVPVGEAARELGAVAHKAVGGTAGGLGWVARR